MSAEAAAAPTALSQSPLLRAAALPTLLRLSLPNMVAMLATALVAIAETSYVGRLGTASLAGLALAFPMVMLQQMMSSGAMGGGVSSAVARALGSGNADRARALAFHAVLIGLAGGLGFTAFFLIFGRAVFGLLGGRGAALDQAVAYSNVVFLGAAGVWLTNTLVSVVRGTGNMVLASGTLFVIAGLQIVIGGGFGLGLGPFPRLGMPGVALGQATAFGLGAVFLLWLLTSGRLPVTLARVPLHRALFRDILKVGAIACISPLQTVATVLILTGLVARFGTAALAGYGIGARLEFLLVPITFAVGVSCVPMVGMAIGAGDVARARRVAWTGGALTAAILGTIGLVSAMTPDLWARMFTADPAVLAAARAYLVRAGPAYGFLGLGLCLYFASQGAGKLVGPVLAGTIRLATVAVGGWWLTVGEAPFTALFALVALAMVAYGVATAGSVALSRWGR